jgi:hypothetical protein
MAPRRIKSERDQRGAFRIELFPYQEKAFAELISTACVLFNGRWRELAIKPRFNLLVVGGTGLGKTQLVRHVGKTLGIPIYEVSTATWMLTGVSGRGAAPTWPSLVRFLLDHRLGLIFLDEIDKIVGEWEWTRYLRTEIFSLLDRTVPANLILRSEDSEHEPLSEARENNIPFSRELVELRLQHGMLIVAAGAFQHFWERTDARSIGFGSQHVEPLKSADVGALAEFLPRELVNRFRAKVILLGPLRLKDYLSILQHSVSRLPPDLQEGFLERGFDTALRAYETRLGVRWVEELITEILIESTNKQMADHISASS